MKKKRNAHRRAKYENAKSLFSRYLLPVNVVKTGFSFFGLFLAILSGVLAYKVFILNSPNSPKISPESNHPLLSDCYGQINGYITDDTLEWFRKWIISLNNQQECKEATLNITSPGGKVDVSFEIISLMSLSKIAINTSCLSACSSAAITVLAHGTGTRYISEFTRGVFHRPEIGGKEIDVIAKNAYEVFYNRFLPKFPEEIRDRIALGENIGLKAQDYIKYGLADTLIKVPKIYSADKEISIEPYVKKSYMEREITSQTTFAYKAVGNKIVNQSGIYYGLHLRYSMDNDSRVCLNATLLSDGNIGNRQESYCYTAKNIPKFNSGTYDEIKSKDAYTTRDYFAWDYANNFICAGTIFSDQSENGNRSISLSCEKVRYIDKKITAVLGTVPLANQSDISDESSIETSSAVPAQTYQGLKIRYYTDNENYTCLTALSTQKSKMGKIVATACYSSWQKPVISADIAGGTKENSAVTDFKIKDSANNAYCIGTQIHSGDFGQDNTSVSLSCSL